MHTDRVEAGVYHIGQTIQAGHYRAFWYTPDRTGIWVSDDNARPQLAAASDQTNQRRQLRSFSNQAVNRPTLQGRCRPLMLMFAALGCLCVGRSDPTASGLARPTSRPHML